MAGGGGGEAVSAEGEAVPEEGEAVPVEGEVVPVEGGALRLWALGEVEQGAEEGEEGEEAEGGEGQEAEAEEEEGEGWEGGEGGEEGVEEEEGVEGVEEEGSKNPTQTPTRERHRQREQGTECKILDSARCNPTSRCIVSKYARNLPKVMPFSVCLRGNYPQTVEEGKSKIPKCKGCKSPK